MRNLIRFLTRQGYVFLFLLLEGLAMVFISNHSHYQGGKIEALAQSISGGVYARLSSITEYFSLTAVNSDLAKENAMLRAEINQSYINYTHKTFSVNDTVYKQQFEYIDAKVISNTVNRRNNYLMLNKGTANQVQKDMAVIAPSGVVGVVTKVSENFATVMTILHKDSRQSVRIKRTKLAGYLIWDGGSYRKGTLVDIPTSLPLQKGDTVVTSGFSQDIPEGIMVGTVDSFQEDGGTGFYKVEINFAVDYNKLDYVYIVRNFFKEEQEALTKGTNNEKEDIRL